MTAPAGNSAWQKALRALGLLFLVLALGSVAGLEARPLWKDPTSWLHERAHILIGSDILDHTYRYANYTGHAPGVYWEPGLPEWPAWHVAVVVLAGPASGPLTALVVSLIPLVISRWRPWVGAALSGPLLGYLAGHTLLLYTNMNFEGHDSDGWHAFHYAGPVPWAAAVVLLTMCLVAALAILATACWPVLAPLVRVVTEDAAPAAR